MHRKKICYNQWTHIVLVTNKLLYLAHNKGFVPVRTLHQLFNLIPFIDINYYLNINDQEIVILASHKSVCSFQNRICRFLNTHQSSVKKYMHHHSSLSFVLVLFTNPIKNHYLHYVRITCSETRLLKAEWGSATPLRSSQGNMYVPTARNEKNCKLFAAAAAAVKTFRGGRRLVLPVGFFRRQTSGHLFCISYHSRRLSRLQIANKSVLSQRWHSGLNVGVVIDDRRSVALNWRRAWERN